ncbi:uncharacterized protein LOC106804480 [Setaria italica]|uniref:uncharacterized protein LOC106804480 n=1 Tax=Setaria italica TaxID=4555 RepID=UPI0007199F43|nr:uncharacterized protein LOC106804480 [Setaria italica]
MVEIFKMSDLGLLSYCLGIEVKQGVEGITLSQGSYARKILEKAGMEECNPCEVPMQAKLKLSQKSESPRVDATDQYRSLVGIGYVSIFMEEPHEEHLAVVKHILRYITGASDLGLKYARKKGDEPLLLGFSDSDLAGDVDSRKSTSGVIFFLRDSPISW